MVAPLCCECKTLLPLSEFAPRNNSIFEDDSKEPLPSDEIWRQPRCTPCNTLYARRRRFVTEQLVPLACSLGLTFSERNGSAFREFQILEACPKEALLEIERRIRAFNDSLAPDRPLSVHGIRLIPPAQIHAGRFFQTVLPFLEPRST